MLSFRKSFFFFSLFFVLAIILPFFVLRAENLAETCDLQNIERQCQGLPASECRKILEKCEKYYQEESNRISADVNKTAKEKKTLQNKIGALDRTIKSLQYQISQSNLVIKDLQIQIGDTETSIVKTISEVEDSKIKLANILKNINEEEQKSLIEVLFSEEKISGFFDNIVNLQILNSKGRELLMNIKELKSNLEKQKESLDSEKEDLEKTVKIKAIQTEQNKQTKGEQEYYLGLTEKEYQAKLKQQQEVMKKANEIRARIFSLIGVPQAPTFGEAYEIAKYVSGVTGVRPAFLLAILQQESSIGKNVGQCYLTNTETGSGKKINTGAAVGKLMKPSRDVSPFLTITSELGRDPFSTPVSCPMSFGWGGAMGPAQFIPSTWMLFRDRIKAVIGAPADPWNIRDAFLAAGFYLADGGASSKTRSGEWRAAMIYFCGSASNTAYSFYADNVLKIADGFEDDIRIIEANK